eukprot:g16446.t1
MIGEPELIFSSLEPWYSDSRRICKRNIDGSISVTHVDEFMHSLLSERQLLDDVAFYELPMRVKMEELDRLDAYESPLADELEQLELEKNIREDEEQRQKEKEEERADRQKRREDREAREKARREARERRNGAMEQGPVLPAIKEEEEEEDKHKASDNEKDEAAEKKSRAGSDSEKSALPKKAKQREGSEHASAPGSPSRASGASSPKRRPSRSAGRGRSQSGDAHPADRDGENKHDRGLGRKTTTKTSSRDPPDPSGPDRGHSRGRKEPAASKKQQSSNADVSSKHTKKKSSRASADESDRRGKTAKEQLEALQAPDEIHVDPSIPRHLLMQKQKPKLPPPGTKKYNDGDDDDKPEVVYQAPKKPRNPDLPSEDDDSDYLENFSTQKKYLDINPNKTSLFGVKAKNEKKEKKRQKEREKAEAKAEEAKKGRKKEYTKEELEEIANENKRRAELGIQPLRL